MKRIAVVVGGRPNYIKLAPIVRALDDTDGIECLLVDAGQHYSPEMRSIFFEEVGLRDNDVWFDVGAGTHAKHTATAMCMMEDWLAESKPDIVMIHGDMDYAVGCALATVKAHIPVIHNEAGLRSFDRSMPEEINRILIDHIADHHLTTESSAKENLAAEGISMTLHGMGSTLADSIKYIFGSIPRWEPKGEYVVVTLHRPSNVDSMDVLKDRIEELNQISTRLGWEVRFYCHPRTRKKIYGSKIPRNFELREPSGYKSFLEEMIGSLCVITDSGGMQEETTILGVPCLTWRPNTERPITIDLGTNCLIEGGLIDNIHKHIFPPPIKREIPKWDGNASERIAGWIKTL